MNASRVYKRRTRHAWSCSHAHVAHTVGGGGHHDRLLWHHARGRGHARRRPRGAPPDHPRRRCRARARADRHDGYPDQLTDGLIARALGEPHGNAPRRRASVDALRSHLRAHPLRRRRAGAVPRRPPCAAPFAIADLAGVLERVMGPAGKWGLVVGLFGAGLSSALTNPSKQPLGDPALALEDLYRSKRVKSGPNTQTMLSAEICSSSRGARGRFARFAARSVSALPPENRENEKSSRVHGSAVGGRGVPWGPPCRIVCADRRRRRAPWRCWAPGWARPSFEPWARRATL